MKPIYKIGTTQEKISNLSLKAKQTATRALQWLILIVLLGSCVVWLVNTYKGDVSLAIQVKQEANKAKEEAGNKAYWEVYAKYYGKLVK